VSNLRRTGLEPAVGLSRPIYSRLPYQLGEPSLLYLLIIAMLCLGQDSNLSLRIFSSVLYLMSYRGFVSYIIGEIGNRTLTAVMQTQNTTTYIISPLITFLLGQILIADFKLSD
jgi:hypothetical protein